MTLPSATSGAVRNFSTLPNSVLPATILSHTISPLSRLIAMTRPSGRLAITRSSHSAMPRVRGALPWCFTPGSHTQTNSPLLGLRASILYTAPQPSVVYMKPLSTSGLTSFSGPFCPTSCMPPSAIAQTSLRFLTLSPFISSQFCGSLCALTRRSLLTVIWYSAANAAAASATADMPAKAARWTPVIFRARLRMTSPLGVLDADPDLLQIVGSNGPIRNKGGSADPSRAISSPRPDLPSRVPRFRHAPAPFHIPALAREGLAREAGAHPVRDEHRRRRPEVGRRSAADRMARVLIHDQLPRALQGLEQPFRVLERAQLVGFAGEAQVRYADFLGVPFPRERLAEFVEAVLVGEPRHVHEALLEGGGGFLEDRVAAGLEARTRHRDRAVTRLARDGDRAEEGAEARADDADAAGIDLGSRREPVHHRAAGRHPVRRAHAMPEHRALVLARALEREHRNAAAEEAVAIHGDVRFLEAVHARNRPHRRDAAALVAGRKMEPAGQRLALERNPRRLDAMVGELGVLRVALALAIVERNILLVVLVERPLRGGVVHGRHEVVRSRGDELSGLLRGLRFRLAAAGGRFERRRDVGEFLHALADRREIRVRLRAAGRVVVDRARLVPVHSDRADGIVEQPALLGPAARLHCPAPGGRLRRARAAWSLFGGRWGIGCKRAGRRRRGSGDERGRLQEPAAIHIASSHGGLLIPLAWCTTFPPTIVITGLMSLIRSAGTLR